MEWANESSRRRWTEVDAYIAQRLVHDDPSMEGVRAFFDALAAEPGVRATAIQTVGSKGYDGFALVLVGG